MEVGGGFTFDSKISTIIYTPCHIGIGSGIKFYGQIFGGESEISGAAKLFYTAVGLPGWDLDTGTASGVNSSPNAWSKLSARNVTG